MMLLVLRHLAALSNVCGGKPTYDRNVLHRNVIVMKRAVPHVFAAMANDLTKNTKTSSR